MAFKSLCLVLCLALYAMEAHGVRNYIAYRRAINFFQSDQACRQMGGKLAVIESEAEHNRAVDAVKAVAGTTTNYYWIGAMDFGYEGHFLWFPINKYAVYKNFATGEPSNNGGAENCVIIQVSKSYMWNDVTCDFGVDGYVCSFDR
ncbi:pulmonary surfactant-associated protein D-like [Anopheles marshallii]|uniref:pulmonary surfactant-associated protein D-like n=1 Tax=Anopheles marshallii TaxID=1521116 RepID=UPI00237A35E2|nr:pulmonary surfactant-associated protein D-like [Anopheles marshallii]